MTGTTTNLDVFCDEPGGRYQIDKPFVVRGWQYATDGRIMVRIPANGDPDVDFSKRRVPRKPEECLPELPEGVRWIKFPNVRECVMCDGHGSVDVQCPHCGQDIKESCKCRKNRVGLGKASISKYYAALIASLPKAEYAEPANADDPVRFRFEGGEGAICLLIGD